MTARFYLLFVFITVAFANAKAQSPGGVSSGLRLWVKANDAAFFATADNTSVATWTDRSGNSYNLTQATATRQPKYRTNAANLINFNPSLVFVDATNQYLGNTAPLLGVTSGYHFLVVSKNTATITTLKGIFNLGSPANFTGSPSLDFEKNALAGNAFNPWVALGTATGESNTPSSAIIGAATVYDGGGVLRHTTTNIPASLAANINNRQAQVFGLSQNLTSTLKCYVDGFQFANDRSAAPANYQANGLKVGTGYDGGGSWDGTINEVIAYGAELSGTNLDKIQSYLAMKYGITLGQGNNLGTATAGTWNVGNNAARTNYLFSDGTTSFDASAGIAGSYLYDIAGIVRDDNSGLTQKQSQSPNYGSMVTLGLGSIYASNAANTTYGINADKSAFMWSANMGGFGTMVANTNYVAGVDGINAILSKRWKVQLTGTGFTGSTIRVAIPANNNIVSASGKLIVSLTGTFDNTSEAKYNLTSSGGYLYADVPVLILRDATYFTFGDITKTPGGVGTNLVAWFKSDADVYNDINGAASVDGSFAAQWLNQVRNAPMNEVNKSGTNLGVGGAGTLATIPTYNTTTKLVNYNPSIVFNGLNSYGLYNYNAVYSLKSAGNATGFHFITVGRDEAAIGSPHSIMGNGVSGNSPGMDLERNAASPNGLNFFTGCVGEWNGGGATIYNNGGIGAGVIGNTPAGYSGQIGNRQPQILGASITGATASCTAVMDVWTDGYKRVTNVPLTGSTTTSMTVYGTTPAVGLNAKEFYIGSSVDFPWTGTVNEVIGYSDKLSDADMQKINTYLAIRYGVTLGQGNNTVNTVGNFHIGENAANYDYLATNGTKIWNATTLNTYRNHIAGIGRDDNEGLVQKQSTSVNFSANNQVTIGLGGIFASNAANSTNAFTNDRSYLVWGDNGQSTTLLADMGTPATTPTFTYNGYTSLSTASTATMTGNFRMKRVWAVTSTSFTQSVQVAIPQLSLDAVPVNGATAPAGNNSGCQKLCLVTADDAAFTSNVKVTVLTAATVNGVASYTANTKFAPGVSYFTFGRAEERPEGNIYLPPSAESVDYTNVVKYSLCKENGWYYYFADGTQGLNDGTKKIFAIHPNGNASFNPANFVAGSSVNTTIDPYQVTDGIKTTSVMGRMLTIVDASATASYSPALKVRFFIDSSEVIAATLENPVSAKWFKHPGDRTATLADQDQNTVNNSIWTVNPAAGSEDGIDYVEYGNVSSFSTFGFASNSGTGAIPLPVKIYNFTAVKAGTAINLSWKVGVEINVEKYEIFRSTDGITFTKTGSVAATGKAGYYFTDNQPVNGTNYYYIKTVDADGRSAYTDTRTVKLNDNGAETIAIFPNPLSKDESLIIRLAGYSSATTGVLYNSLGQIVSTKLLTNGNNNYPTLNLPAGVYSLKVIQAVSGKSTTTKIVIK